MIWWSSKTPVPIRRDERHHYGYTWRTVTRPRILRRAGGKFSKGEYIGGAHCEACRVVDGDKVIYHAKHPQLYFVLDPQLALFNSRPVAKAYNRSDGEPVEMWEDLSSYIERGERRDTLKEYRELLADWRNQGWNEKALMIEVAIRGLMYRPVMVVAQIGVAHVNHKAGDDRPRNLKALCRRCHLKHDEPQHKENREARKDRERPLLKGAIRVKKNGTARRIS